MDNLHIAFLAYNLEQGGAERQLFYIIKSLIQQGYRPDVYTFGQGGFWEAPLRKLGVRVIYINERGKAARLAKFLKLISQGNYHYVHSQQFCTNLYAVAVSSLCNVKCIGSIRNDVISEVRDMGFMGWLSLILPSQMVANSRQAMENARSYFRDPKSIFFLPNVVDTEIFSPRVLKKTTDCFKVITVGTIWKPKRIDRVIEIAELLKQRTKRRIIFDVIGDGEQLEAMIAMAEAKELLNSTIFFRGRSSNMAFEYRDADALLLTSDFEGTPNVVLEAMASGLPVIASRVGDVPKIILDGENGFSAEREDIKKMADAIENLSEDDALCLSIGQQAREFVISNYSPSKLAGRLAELYLLIDRNH